MRQGAELTEESGKTEDTYELRLMSLLQDLVKEKGRRGAARVLGVDHRTVAACVEGGKLSKRVRGALEFALLTGADPEAERRERLAALETRVGELEKWARASQLENRRAIEEGLSGLREDHSRALEHVEKRLAALEAGLVDLSTSKPTANAKANRAVKSPMRQYPEIVTLEPEPGEEQVYGDVVPLIVEWRRVRNEVLAGGDSKSARKSVDRLRELEVALIGEHGLTLPPALHPWDRIQRRDELERRTRAMKESRRGGLRGQFMRWLARFRDGG